MLLVHMKDAFHNGIVENLTNPTLTQIKAIDEFTCLSNVDITKSHIQVGAYNDNEQQPSMKIIFDTNAQLSELGTQMMNVMEVMNEQVYLAETYSGKAYYMIGRGFDLTIDEQRSGKPLKLVYTDKKWVILSPKFDGGFKIQYVFPDDMPAMVALNFVCEYVNTFTGNLTNITKTLDARWKEELSKLSDDQDDLLDEDEEEDKLMAALRGMGGSNFGK